MFPLRDSTPRHSFPFVNYVLIAVNAFVFLAQLSSPDPDAFVLNYAFIPSQFNLLDPQSYVPIFTSIFVHGGFFHIISNMWFLHIFGDNVEDTLGHIPYFVFYLLGGLVATLAQYFLYAGSNIPMIGASGAVSAIAGAYFVYFRRSSIKALVTYVFVWQVVELPVWFFLGYWFIIQVFSGVGSLVTLDVQTGGIAWFAHVGGFVFGYLISKIYAPKTHSFNV